MRRLLFFLGLNAIVSAVVTLAVLLIWDATHPAAPGGAPAATQAALPEDAGTAAPEVTPLDGGAAPAAQPTEAAPAGPPGLATITPTVYVVQGGDTLGKIADEFGVTLEDLMAANGLTDPNVLDVGQTLQIPIGGEVQVIPTEAPPPTDTAEAQPTEAGVEPADTPVASGAAQLAIRGITGAGDSAQERVLIMNVAGELSLAGWTLADEQGNVFFFPALSLFDGGAVTVHTTTGANTVTDLYWNQTVSVWQPGETARLIDPTGATHTTFVVP